MCSPNEDQSWLGSLLVGSDPLILRTWLWPSPSRSIIYQGKGVGNVVFSRLDSVGGHYGGDDVVDAADEGAKEQDD